ncbi:hypothetical protein C4K88_03910 [Arthrobacter pityocampae]|uniref:Uncharacterized protein n=1 Tax=Arthrobacter pityocampae TaxID=547334 RepID=A0A2S5IZ80_9MICC|nr:hypothetical protein C4K88_03910 [Arthrobacter pityocampae]
MGGQEPDRRRANREFGLRLLIPAALFVGLLVLIVSTVPSEVILPAVVVVSGGVLAGGIIGFLTGVRGPHWPIYALIFTTVAVLLLLPSPWQGLALVAVPAAAGGYAMGKEIAFFRLDRRHPVPLVNH